MAVGCLVAGPLLDMFGRKFGLICATLPAALGWMITGIGGGRWSIFIGRALTGLASGFSGAASASYVAEMASPSTRSALTVISPVSFSLGITLVYFFGLLYKEDWGIVALVCGIIPLTCLLLVAFWLPESSAWRRRPPAKPGPPVAWLTRSEVYRPLLIINAVLFFRQISGASAILSNAVELVQGGGATQNNAHWMAILLGLGRVTACLIASWLCNRLGRRRPVAYAGTSMCASVLALSASLEGWQGPPKLFLFSIWILSSTIFGAVPQAMVGELFPTEVRGACSAVCSFVASSTAFVAVMTYPWLRNYLDFPGLFCLFGVLAVIDTVLAIFLLPETHGKTLEQINEHFKKSKSIEGDELEYAVPLKARCKSSRSEICEEHSDR